MFGNRAIYNNGWIATARHGRLPWENSGAVDFDKDIWQLYKLDEDFSEANDLSANNPGKLKELQDLFWVEAEKYNVLPLDDRFIERADPSMRPSLIEGRTKFAYLPGVRRIPESSTLLNAKKSARKKRFQSQNPRALKDSNSQKLANSYAD